MKSKLSVILVIALLFTSLSTSFAEGQINQKVIIEPLANQFGYEYVETNYEYHTTAIVTEQDIDNAIKLAADELSVLSYFVGGILGAPLAYAIKTNASKAVLKAILSKYVPLNSYLQVITIATSAGINHLAVYASKSVINKKYKYKYQVNLLTGARTLMETWITYKSDNFYRVSSTSSWISDGTTIETLRLQ